ncbi:hypothetical protein M0804_002520 [Polistes exclamans]|nr:hypothetical protein M0804_002520 [Polistes exclamans]
MCRERDRENLEPYKSCWHYRVRPQDSTCRATGNSTLHGNTDLSEVQRVGMQRVMHNAYAIQGHAIRRLGDLPK